jgi:hypothetical protein
MKLIRLLIADAGVAPLVVVIVVSVKSLVQRLSELPPNRAAPSQNPAYSVLLPKNWTV